MNIGRTLQLWVIRAEPEELPAIEPETTEEQAIDSIERGVALSETG